MTLRQGLILIDGLLVVLLVIQLVKRKRQIDSYRPPYPMAKSKVGSSLTITRVS